MSSEALERADEMIAALLAEVARLEQERDEAHGLVRATKLRADCMQEEADGHLAARESAEAALAVAREREQRLREVLVRIERWGGGAPEIAADMMRDLACAARIEADQDDDPAAATLAEPDTGQLSRPVSLRASAAGTLGDQRAAHVPSAGPLASGSASAAADEPGETPPKREGYSREEAWHDLLRGLAVPTDRAQDTEAIRAALRRSEGFTASSASEAFLALGRLVARLEAAERDVALCAADTTAPDLAQDIEFLKAEKEQMQERLERKQETNRVLAVEQGRLMGAYAKARDEIASLRAALATAAPGEKAKP